MVAWNLMMECCLVSELIFNLETVSLIHIKNVLKGLHIKSLDICNIKVDWEKSR